MLLDLTKERLHIKHDEKTLREMSAQGSNHAKVMLATLLVGQSQEKDMESSKLLHEVCSDETASKEAKKYSYSLLGDLAMLRKSYMAAENYYKEAMDLGATNAINSIKTLYESGHLTKTPHHDDYNYLYRQDVDLAAKIKSVDPMLEKITADLRKSTNALLVTPKEKTSLKKKSTITLQNHKMGRSIN